MRSCAKRRKEMKEKWPFKTHFPYDARKAHTWREEGASPSSGRFKNGDNVVYVWK
jgi:hypothetical protein